MRGLESSLHCYWLRGLVRATACDSGGCLAVPTGAGCCTSCTALCTVLELGHLSKLFSVSFSLFVNGSNDYPLPGIGESFT